MSKTSATQQFISNVRANEYKFFNQLTSAFEQYNNGNNTDIARLICFANGWTSKIVTTVEKDRMPFATILKRILDTTPIEYKKDAKKGMGLRFVSGGNAHIAKETLDTIKMLHGKRIVHADVKEAFPVVKKDQGEKTLEQKQKQGSDTIDRLAKQWDMPRAQVKALLSAC